MIRTGILAAATLAYSAGAMAQSADFDDRFYLSARSGMINFDDKRDLSAGLFVGFGFGKYLSPDWAIDVEYTADRRRNTPDQVLWSHYGLGVNARYFPGDPSALWRPYGMFGVSALRSDRKFTEKSTNPALNFGIGVERNANDRVRGRVELSHRFDLDDTTIRGQKDYGDWMLTVGMTIALGPDRTPAAPPAPPPPPPPPPPRETAPPPPPVEPPCPPARPGQIVGPDGCPVDVTIDLRGVTFEFDSARLRPESIATLNEAVDILKRFNTIRVEVAGHTCNIGSETYNKGLSERRAQTVFDYLVQNGIEANRLRSAGYGLTRPLQDNSTQAGREANRRTELVILN